MLPIGCVLLLLPIAVLAGAQPAAAPRADTVFTNAIVYTVDAEHPKAEALAVAGDKIAYVGTAAGALALKGPTTRVVDLHGATVVPGLTDAHGHFTGLGDSLRRLDLVGTTSYDQIVAIVARKVASTKPGEWILGRGWDQNRWPDQAFPTHDRLSAVSPNNPVYLTRVDGHAGLANRKAMDLAGVTRATNDPEGGRIVRAAAGDPTGVFVDRAQGLVQQRIPRATPAQLREAIQLADRECSRVGLTTVHDAGAGDETVAAYRELIAAGKLRTRLYVMLREPLAQLRPWFARGPQVGLFGQHLTIRSVKMAADGALGSRGAALLAPYSDDPGNIGLLTTPAAELDAVTEAGLRAGFQICIHAIGDRGNRIVLDLFERALKAVPAVTGARLRVEHAQVLSPQDIPRFAALHVIPSMQATHATSDRPWAGARLGPDRIRGAYAWRSLLKTGVYIANGSDFPVESPDPLKGFYAAITRQDVQGQPPGGWDPDQRMTREEALRSFTIDTARAAFEEKIKGSLEPGKLADFLVLSRDIMTAPPPEILTTEVLRTVIGGQTVYEKGNTAQHSSVDSR